jgi:hypothetical protein
MLRCFGDLIRQTVEAYVDDIMVKSKQGDQLVADLEQTFARLRANRITKKCVFGVLRGMLLGFIVSKRGIKANPEKIAAITTMGPIQNLKGVQRVTGCLAALNRFISCLGERGPPLYWLLRKTNYFTWTLEAQEVLDRLKALLMEAPILVPPTDQCWRSSPPWSWSGKRRGTPSRCNAPFIS